MEAQEKWRVTLPELSQACRAFSPRLHLRDEENRRVQWDLQPRVIRYYTTLGLLDRACEKRGRNMYYGVRHLLQLLAIKQLQAQGRSLAEIQALLLGNSDEELRQRLGLGEDWKEMLADSESESEPPASPDRREDFWRQSVRRPPRASPLPSAVPKLCFRLPQGVEVLIPQEIWERLDPEAWSEWLGALPE